MTAQIGRRIRSLRISQKRTLQEIADLCGFTRGLLSKIETGKTAPPIATLAKIASALGVKVAALLEENTRSNRTVFVPAALAHPGQAIATSKGYSFVPLASSRIDKTMQPYLFRAHKEALDTQPMTHLGEEFIYILDGQMSYRVGSVEYTMGPGDSLYFDSTEEHLMKPITETVTYLAVFTQPEE